MLFSTPLFLFLFLPLVLLFYFTLRSLRARNYWLLAASLVFYGWGEPGFLLLLLQSTLVNYVAGRALERTASPARRKGIVAGGIVFNLGLLAGFKYFNFALDTLNAGLQALGATPIAAKQISLPLGISFFTFHAISYLVDIYRRAQKAATQPADVALYIFLFPQLIAGPILRWNAIAPQLAAREHSLEKFAAGVRRFLVGLAKKVLIANTLALAVDQIFALPAGQLGAATAWFGAVGYLLQIYFDFSGYSDMAVGLGKMFGFEFLENFRLPYTAQSIQDFWRRWHISLSTWFRDYVYFPLGGNRRSGARTCANLLTVFFLCGLWHGASWTFVVWGLYHGLFLVLERTAFGAWLQRLPPALRHAYVLPVVLVGWVIFRSDDFAAAGNFLYAMAGCARAPLAQPLMRYATDQVLAAMLIGAIASTAIPARLIARVTATMANRPAVQALGYAAEISALLLLLFLCAARLAAGTYNPFIYFRF